MFLFHFHFPCIHKCNQNVNIFSLTGIAFAPCIPLRGEDTLISAASDYWGTRYYIYGSLSCPCTVTTAFLNSDLNVQIQRNTHILVYLVLLWYYQFLDNLCLLHPHILHCFCTSMSEVIGLNWLYRPSRLVYRYNNLQKGIGYIQFPPIEASVIWGPVYVC